MKSMKILGMDVNDYDTACALVQNGRIIAAAQEERFCGEKQTRRFPARSLSFCLEKAGLNLGDLDTVAISVNPAIYLEALNPVQSERVRFRGELLYSPVNYMLGLQRGIENLSTSLSVHLKDRPDLRIQYVTHHDAHAAVGFFPSPFQEAAIFSADGFGEKETMVHYHARNNEIKRLASIEFPHSLGLFYSVVTEYLGLRHHNDEWKVMGAAGHGNPKRYRKHFQELLRYSEDGLFEMDLSYFNHYLFHRPGGYTPKWTELFGSPYEPGQEPDERFFDIAAAAQVQIEEVVFEILRHLFKRTRTRNLCMTGGVAMNCLLNGKIHLNTPFENVFVPPMPTDAGTSIGAALWTTFNTNRRARRYRMAHNYFGPSFSDDQIGKELGLYKIPCRRLNRPEKTCARLLSDGWIVGWFQGELEFGDRALGNRSILADPRDVAVKQRINEAVKFREAYRPFAPSILEEKAAEYFDYVAPSPFMDRIINVRPEKRPLIPAVVHVDGSARLQTVSKKQNPLFHGLIREFERLTGVPIVLNTSLNVQGEPIVCSPRNAIRTFYTSGLDALILGPYLLVKSYEPHSSQTVMNIPG